MKPLEWRVSSRLSLMVEPRDVWVGLFVGDDALYICLLPCLVICWSRPSWRSR